MTINNSDIFKAIREAPSRTSTFSGMMAQSSIVGPKCCIECGIAYDDMFALCDDCFAMLARIWKEFDTKKANVK
jgi:hypothetical protein